MTVESGRYMTHPTLKDGHSIGCHAGSVYWKPNGHRSGLEAEPQDTRDLLGALGPAKPHTDTTAVFRNERDTASHQRSLDRSKVLWDWLT